MLDTKYGEEGTPQHVQSENEAKAFYVSQVFLQARKEAETMQTELAEKAGTIRSYIPRVESRLIEPGVGLFFRLVNSLGLRIDISKPIGQSH